MAEMTIDQAIADCVRQVPEWRDVPGLDGYQVSSDGRVRGKRGTEYVVRLRNGYPSTVVRMGGHKQTTVSIHRLVAAAFVPNPMRKPEVNHKNGLKTDNRPENLEWVTPGENRRHAFDTGLMVSPKGERNGKAKLNASTVQKIHDLTSQGLSLVKIAKLVGVGQTAVHSVRSGRTWGHLAAACKLAKGIKP